tara:strand:+ start:767 stop:982 length:216 start_codon:yes stop_codon:yes gene_type:complete
MSPKKREMPNIIAINNSKPKYLNKSNDKKNEEIVPLHVFLGLIFGIINGPLKVLPNKYAEVSFKKEIKKIM